MTPEERQLLTDLAAKVSQTPPPQRDPEAEELIRTRIGSRPDALYLMTQTVLIQNMALDHAKQEIEKLKQAAAAPPPAAGGAGFLNSQPYMPQGQPYASYGTPQPPPATPSSGGGMSSFLRSAASTATGVAAGALAFEGIRSLLGGIGGGFEHLGGFGSGSGLHQASSFLGGGAGETIINNYYEKASDSTEDTDTDDSDTDDTDVDNSDDSDDTDSVDDDSSDDSSSSDDDLV